MRRRYARKQGLPPNVLVDADLFCWASKYTWWLHKSSPSSPPCVRGLVQGKFVYLHRLIGGAERGQDIDHINGNRLDNRRANLRVVSRGQNLQNRTRLQKSNTSGIRGVYWSASREKWIAEAKVNSKSHRIGYFNDIEEASAAVRDWRRNNMPFSEADK